MLATTEALASGAKDADAAAASFVRRLDNPDEVAPYKINKADVEAMQVVVTEKLKRKPKQSDQDALQERVGLLAMQPLDRKHPLWQFHLVDAF